MHPLHTPQDFPSTIEAFLVLERKLCHGHIDDPIHMHFHDNPTDSQHDFSHTYEVILGSTTLSNSADTARSTFGYQVEARPSTFGKKRKVTLSKASMTRELHK